MSIISGANAVAGAGGAAAYEIERSLRFNSADSAYLNRTFGSAGNRQTWTWSAWVKRSGFVNNPQRLFYTGNSNDNETDIYLSGDRLTIEYYVAPTNYYLISSPKLRDPSAWYHLVVVVDTTNATSTDRMRLYINGLRVTNFDNTSYPAQNANLTINSAAAHYIGRRSDGSNSFDGYLTEINFIDGQALDPTSFGEYNSDTGVWQPIAYEGTYGTNGFYLNFSDNSGTTSTTLGKDYSGNSNNWTPNNFSVTAGAGNDSLVDTPTPYGTDTGAGGEVRGNYATLNPVASIGTYLNGNLDWVGQSSGDNTAASTIGVTSGKWYWEVQALSLSNLGTNGVIYDPSRADLTTTGGYNSPNGYAMDWSSSPPLLKYGGTSTSYGTTITSTSDVVMVALDLDNQKLYFGRNGTWFNSSNPATGTSPAVSSLPSSKTWFATVGDQWGSASSQWSTNFGQRPFAYAAPSGFKALCTTNLPDPAIADGSQYFETKLRSGNGSQTAITGIGWQPGLVWTKTRNTGGSHNLEDIVRGAVKSLASNGTDAEKTTGTAHIVSFDSNGYTVSADTSDGQVNYSGQTYVDWLWKAGGTGVSNTAGTNTSAVVSANPTAGFSVVTYTGDGTAGATVGHGLSVAPSFLVVKNRDTAGEQWVVYHKTLGGTQYLKLSDTSAVGASVIVWNNTDPTSSVITLGNWSAVNQSTKSHVCYAFSPVEGYSAFGSYTGNGSTTGDGPFVYTGFRPKYLLIKSSSASATNWVVQDTTRFTYNLVDDGILANTSAAEYSSGYDVDILSNGFKIRRSGGDTNASSATYIYAAFAENPFKYSLAR